MVGVRRVPVRPRPGRRRQLPRVGPSPLLLRAELLRGDLVLQDDAAPLARARRRGLLPREVAAAVLRRPLLQHRPQELLRALLQKRLLGVVVVVAPSAAVVARAGGRRRGVVVPARRAVLLLQPRQLALDERAHGAERLAGVGY